MRRAHLIALSRISLDTAAFSAHRSFLLNVKVAPPSTLFQSFALGKTFFVLIASLTFLGVNQLPSSTLCGVSSLVMRVCGLNANGKRIHIYVCLSAKREMPTSPKWALTCCLPAVRQSGERPAKRHHNEQDGSTDLQQQNSKDKFRVRYVLLVKQFLLRLGIGIQNHTTL